VAAPTVPKFPQLPAMAGYIFRGRTQMRQIQINSKEIESRDLP
jgi:hypothetical protein